MNKVKAVGSEESIKLCLVRHSLTKLNNTKGQLNDRNMGFSAVDLDRGITCTIDKTGPEYETTALEGGYHTISI